MVIFKNTAAILSQDISNTNIKTIILFIFMHIKAADMVAAFFVSVPAILKQFNNAIKFLKFCPYYYSSVKFS